MLDFGNELRRPRSGGAVQKNVVEVAIDQTCAARSLAVWSNAQSYGKEPEEAEGGEIDGKEETQTDAKSLT